MANETEKIPESTGSLAGEPETPRQPAAPAEGAGFPIVGIGASAGGLEALEEFFEHLPPDSGMAFVIVTHQPLDRVSLLPELLRKRTAMPVQEVTAAVQVEPNHVYLSSPGMHLALRNAALHPVHGDTVRGGLPFPIDYFFRSLADDQKDRAICIVLSGTGTDGTLGLQAVKGAGGMTMVQEEKSAKFAGMPSSAIATGQVDYVLPAAQLPQALLTFVRGTYLQGVTAPTPLVTLTPDLLRQIYTLLRNRTKHDFFRLQSQHHPAAY
ncbi:MAG: chemotaxis protein CheB [candidate division KSB1 bacterium]|nr:chemotaxis protein CheB [candidate division KSB1 bacterium]